MIRNRYRALLIVITLLFLSGCAGGIEAIQSGIAGSIAYVRASAAESRGDRAYEGHDYAAALDAFRTAAEYGGAHGQFMLATMYLAGEGVQRNPEQYLRWMELSAESGYPAANYLMGMAHLSMNPEEAARAIHYFETAAAREHAGAMHMLGLIYASGTGVPRNTGESLRWFRMAHSQGFPIEKNLLTEAGIEAYAQQLEEAAPPPPRSAAPVSEYDLIREIQQGLTELGYDPGPVDGIYGSKTGQAIEAFQRNTGMKPDGTVSQRVFEAVREETAAISND